MWSRRCASALLAAFLTGCAGPQVSSRDTAADLSKKAVVIVSATHDAETGVRGKAVFSLSDLTRQGALDRRELRSIETVLGIPVGSDFSDVHGQVYVLSLEPGAYQFDGWRVISGHAVLWPRNPGAPLVFEVRAGEVLYLGNLNMRNQLGRGGWPGVWVVVNAEPEVRDRREVDIPIAERKAPGIRGKAEIRLLQLGPWSPAHRDSEVRVQPIPITVPVPMPVR